MVRFAVASRRVDLEPYLLFEKEILCEKEKRNNELVEYSKQKDSRKRKAETKKPHKASF